MPTATSIIAIINQEQPQTPMLQVETPATLMITTPRVTQEQAEARITPILVDLLDPMTKVSSTIRDGPIMPKKTETAITRARNELETQDLRLPVPPEDLHHQIPTPHVRLAEDHHLLQDVGHVDDALLLLDPLSTRRAHNAMTGHPRTAVHCVATSRAKSAQDTHQPHDAHTAYKRHASCVLDVRPSSAASRAQSTRAQSARTDHRSHNARRVEGNLQDHLHRRHAWAAWAAFHQQAAHSADACQQQQTMDHHYHPASHAEAPLHLRDVPSCLMGPHPSSQTPPMAAPPMAAPGPPQGPPQPSPTYPPHHSAPQQQWNLPQPSPLGSQPPQPPTPRTSVYSAPTNGGRPLLAALTEEQLTEYAELNLAQLTVEDKGLIEARRLISQHRNDRHHNYLQWKHHTAMDE